MGFDDIANDAPVDPEVLMDEDVAEAPDLRPRDLRVRTGDLFGKMVHGLTDDLAVALDRILCHLHDLTLGIKSDDVPLATFDRLENIIDSLSGAAGHSATASTSAEVEIGRLSNWNGNTSMSSRPNSARVSSIRPEARISRFPSAGSISTRMSMSDPGRAVPRATDPKSFGLVAPYRSRSTWNSSRRESRSSRRASVSGVVEISGILSVYRPQHPFETSASHVEAGIPPSSGTENDYSARTAGGAEEGGGSARSLPLMCASMTARTSTAAKLGEIATWIRPSVGPSDAWMKLPIANTSISELHERSPGEWAVKTVNDTSHLVSR